MVLIADDGIIGMHADVHLHARHIRIVGWVVAQREGDVLIRVVRDRHVVNAFQSPQGSEFSALARREPIVVGVAGNGLCPNADAFLGTLIHGVDVLHGPEWRPSSTSFSIGVPENGRAGHSNPLADAHDLGERIVENGSAVDVREMLDFSCFRTQFLLFEIEHGPLTVGGIEFIILVIERQGIPREIDALWFDLNEDTVHRGAHFICDPSRHCSDAGPPTDGVWCGAEEFFGIATSAIDESSDSVFIQDAGSKVLAMNQVMSSELKIAPKLLRLGWWAHRVSGTVDIGQ